MRAEIVSSQVREKLLGILTGPPILAFVPALSLASFWLGGEVALATVALGVPLIFAGAGAFGHWNPQANYQNGLAKQLMPKDQFHKQLESLFTSVATTDTNSVCIVFSIDNISEISNQYGQATAEVIWSRCRERAMSIVRSRDIAAQIDKNEFALALRPSPHLDLEASISLSGRLQSAVEEPVHVRGTSIFASCSIGFCVTDKVSGETAAEWLEAAIAALVEASRNGPSTIRAYTLETKRRTALRADLKAEFRAALTTEEIRPWFQPQISTETGQITGFEALARWEHSGKGTLGPHVFLPFAEQSGLMEQLGQSMRRHVFSAVRAWDDAGLAIPRVGVNFSADELRNPALVDSLKWELDEFDLSPGRLSVEVLETVFSNQPDDIITRNIACLADLG
ncbi:MAG: EAL domain-containing protein, partial [Ruegeria sp.]